MSNDRTAPSLHDFAESDSAYTTTKRLRLTPGDFLKNAGNVGFLRLWEFICRDRGEEFDVVDEIPIEKLPDEKKLAQYIMDLYISEYSGDSRVQKTFDKLDGFVELIDSGHLPNGSSVNEENIDSFININELKLLKGFKCDFDGIKDQVDYIESYVEFLEKKALKGVELIEIVRKIKKFCDQKVVKRAFLFRDATRNIVEPFLQNRSFLDYSNNSRKNVEKLIEEDFTHPFTRCLETRVEHSASNQSSKNMLRCISCSNTFAKPSSKSKLFSLTFAKGIVDNLEDKASLFWNFNPDAYLCPVCSLFLLMAPLGFRRIGNGDFIFINSDSSIDILWNDNAKRIEDINDGTDFVRRGTDSTRLMLLDDKTMLLSNSQVIIRNKQEGKKDKNGSPIYQYLFRIIDCDLLYLIFEERLPSSSCSLSVHDCLECLIGVNSFKTSNGDDFNVYRLCLDNLLNFRNQYNLLNMLVLDCLRTSSKMKKEEEIQKRNELNTALSFVFRIQCLQTYHMLKGEECDLMKNISKLQFCASKEGASMRKCLLINAVGEEKAAQLPSDRKEEIIRSVVYRLANALKTRNVELFVDTLIRLYSSCKEPIPTVFMTALRNEEVFPLVGYAYLLGLKGAFYQSEKAEDVEVSD